MSCPNCKCESCEASRADPLPMIFDFISELPFEDRNEAIRELLSAGLIDAEGAAKLREASAADPLGRTFLPVSPWMPR